VPVEKIRFDHRDESDPPDWEYHGYFLTYTEPGYRLDARYYEHEPDRVTVLAVQDPPRRGFGEEIPYSDPRLARAAGELLASVGATRLYLADRGADGSGVFVNLDRLRSDSSN
jgi:hypothetical protein